MPLKGSQSNQLIERGDSLGLPLPRLQLTWMDESPGHWLCHYELLVPVQKHDMRDEHKRGYIVLDIGKTRMNATKGPVRRDGVLDPPFRDGAHAQWDSDRLGVPVFVVYGEVYRRLNVPKEESRADG